MTVYSSATRASVTLLMVFLLVACRADRSDPRETVYQFAQSLADGDSTAVCELASGSGYDSLNDIGYCSSSPSIGSSNGIRLLGACEITTELIYTYWFEANQSFSDYFGVHDTEWSAQIMRIDLEERGEQFYVSEIVMFEQEAGILDMAYMQDVEYEGQACARGLEASVQ